MNLGKSILTKVMKLTVMVTVAVATVSLFTATSAQAKGGGMGFVTNLDLSYSSSEVVTTVPVATPPETTDKQTSIVYDLNLGYAMSNGLYLGLIYFSRTVDQAGASVPTLTGYGPSVGYMASNGFFVTGHYILSASSEKLNAAGAKFDKGSGIQADLGYQMNVSGAFSVGVLLTYRSLNFTNYNDGTTDDSTYKQKDTNIYPQLRLGFMF